MFVTFYSYKGGVGRSLALANTACLMAEDEEHPQRVLVWDFDLEAPGLHRLFPPKTPQTYGFVDVAYEYASTGKIPPVDDYIYESEIEGVHVLPAGKLGEQYCEKLQKIDWVRFFGKSKSHPSDFFSRIKEEIGRRRDPYDYVLIDSRTGLNDQAGICTQELPDLLVVLLRLSPQNLEGVEHVVPALKSQFVARDREVEIMPVASQVGTGDPKTLAKAREKARGLFEKPLEYIRFDVELVSKEKLFCLRREMTEQWPQPPIVDDYRRICTAIREKNSADTRSQLEELRDKLRSGDEATAWSILLRLLPRRPRLQQLWRYLERGFSDMPTSRRSEFKRIVSGILCDDKTNAAAYQWQAALQSAEAQTPRSRHLNEAKASLTKALKSCRETERGGICRSLALIESCQGNLAKAVKTLREVQEGLPKNNQILLDLAVLHMRMGSRYFVLAADELESVSEDIGDERAISLSYIYTFLGDTDRALRMIESCAKEMRPLAKAHMFLIEGKKKAAIEVADKEMDRSGSWAESMNWAELYLCAGEFSKVSRIEVSQRDPDESSDPQLANIKRLARFLNGKRKDYSEELETLLKEWASVSWNFRELLLFRECQLREGKDRGGRLEVIERLIQQQQLSEITSARRGLIARRRPRGHAKLHVVFNTK